MDLPPHPRPHPNSYFRPSEQDLANTKRKQINTLRIFNENVVEVTPDVQYSVTFDLRETSPATENATLVVFLPPGFPRERPGIRLATPAWRHPWLDTDGNVVGAPGLINYTIHSDLGRVVQAIKSELQKNLTQVGGQQSLPYPISQQAFPPPPLKGGQVRPSEAFSQSLFASNFSPRPNLPTADSAKVSAIPGLSDLSVVELKKLLNSDVSQRVFAKNLKIPIRDRHDRDISKTRNEVERLLRENKELQDRVDESRSTLLEKVSTCNAERAIVKDLHSGLQKRHQKDFSVLALTAKLNESSLEDEEKSDAIAEEFLSGNLDVQQFRDNYIETRASYHARKVKRDKLQDRRLNL